MIIKLFLQISLHLHGTRRRVAFAVNDGIDQHFKDSWYIYLFVASRDDIIMVEICLNYKQLWNIIPDSDCSTLIDAVKVIAVICVYFYLYLLNFVQHTHS